MKNLIKRILREQLENEEDFSPVIPKFNYEKKYKNIYNYLDNLGLVKRKPAHYKGIVFAYPNDQYGTLGWENDGTLWIHYKLIDEISDKFNMNIYDYPSIIGKWFTDRYKLEVKNTYVDLPTPDGGFAIDTD